MINRVLEIATEGAFVSKRYGSITIVVKNSEPTVVPIDTIDSLIMHQGASITTTCIEALSSSGAAIIFCNGKHMPSSIVLPLVGYHGQAARQRLQIEMSEPFKKRVWSYIVERKIAQQSRVVELTTGKRTLHRYMGPVRSGDPENKEAQAARAYWPELFGRKFLRDGHEGPINARLNFGYAIIRSCVSRAVVACGLLPSLSVHHSDARNAFALVDDIMEPYRPAIDLQVLRLAEQGQALDTQSKSVLASSVISTITTDRGATTLGACILRTVQSFAHAIETKSPAIWYPESVIS